MITGLAKTYSFVGREILAKLSEIGNRLALFRVEESSSSESKSDKSSPPPVLTEFGVGAFDFEDTRPVAGVSSFLLLATEES
jgi:hypothetical protein